MYTEIEKGKSLEAKDRWNNLIKEKLEEKITIQTKAN